MCNLPSWRMLDCIQCKLQTWGINIEFAIRIKIITTHCPPSPTPQLCKRGKGVWLGTRAHSLSPADQCTGSSSPHLPSPLPPSLCSSQAKRRLELDESDHQYISETGRTSRAKRASALTLRGAKSKSEGQGAYFVVYR